MENSFGHLVEFFFKNPTSHVNNFASEFATGHNLPVEGIVRTVVVSYSLTEVMECVETNQE